MSNEERLHQIELRLDQADAQRYDWANPPDAFVAESQIASAQTLVLIARILDEMNEREKADSDGLAKLAACVRLPDGEDDAP